MNLFDKLVQTALEGNESLRVIQPAVEKEILHHEVLREMASIGVLKKLVFMGGTCLRNCRTSGLLDSTPEYP